MDLLEVQPNLFDKQYEMPLDNILPDPAKVVRDLPSVEFFYSKEKSLYSSFIQLLVIFVGMYMLISKPQLMVLGVIISAVGIVFFLIEMIKVFDKKPVLVISSTEIWGRKFGTILWSDIEKIRVVIIKSKPYLDIFRKSAMSVNDGYPDERVEIWKLNESDIIECLVADFMNTPGGKFYNR
jgi:hypothetical protein